MAHNPGVNSKQMLSSHKGGLERANDCLLIPVNIIIAVANTVAYVIASAVAVAAAVVIVIVVVVVVVVVVELFSCSVVLSTNL